METRAVAETIMGQESEIKNDGGWGAMDDGKNACIHPSIAAHLRLRNTACLLESQPPICHLTSVGLTLLTTFSTTTVF